MTASKALLNLINEWAGVFADYLSSPKLVEKILKQAEDEQLGKKELRLLIETALKKRGLSDGQIRRDLPQELKRTYVKSEKTTTSRIMRDSSQPKLVHKDSSEVELPPPTTEITEAEIIPNTRTDNPSATPPDAGSSAMGPAPEIITLLQSKVKALELAINDIENHSPVVVQLRHDKDLAEERVKKLEDVIRKQGAGFASAAGTPLPRWVRLEMVKIGTRGVWNAWFDNGGIIYLSVVDDDVRGAESATEHLKKNRPMEAAH
jgi:hypothetical protein